VPRQTWPAVLEAGAGDGGHRVVEVAVGEDHGGVLAAELQRHRADAVGAGLHDRGAGLGLAGEGDAVDVRVGEVRKAPAELTPKPLTTL
jgi:hypothetical protein